MGFNSHGLPVAIFTFIIVILDLLFSGVEWVAAARTEEMEWRGGGEP